MEKSEEVIIQKIQDDQEKTKIDPAKAEALVTKMQHEQSFIAGLIACFVTCLITALIWAAITVSTGYQIGYMAIAVGFLVGYANRYAGKGMEMKFGIAGAAFALLGCILGNYFSVIGFVSNEFQITYIDAFKTFTPGLVLEYMKDTFSPMDILFYGLALYEGYKFSFRKISEEELQSQLG